MQSRQIFRAETAGFCMGVQLALNKLDQLIAEHAPGQRLYTLGPIIHNPQVLEEYAAKGICSASAPEDIPQGAAVVIRAHGVPKEIEARIKERDVRIIDATCPKVKKAQVLIARSTAQGRTLLLFGEESHPEVKGLLSYAAAGSFVFDDPASLEKFTFNTGDRYCLASQTTQDRAAFLEIAEELRTRPGMDLKILQTVCDATMLRQEEVRRIAGQVEFMVVAGGLTSGNTRRLRQVAEDLGVPSLHVETAGDLPLEQLRRYGRIGLTAGASTPKGIIDQVESALKRL